MDSYVYAVTQASRKEQRLIEARNRYRVYEQEAALKAFFPKHDMHVLDTGHWGKRLHIFMGLLANSLLLVQAEKPNEFLELVVDFLKADTGPQPTLPNDPILIR